MMITRSITKALRSVLVASLAITLTGCITQASPDVEARLAGNYTVVEQSAKQPIRITNVKVKFFRAEDGPSAGIVTVKGASTVKWRFSECGTTAGNRLVSIDDRSMVEGILCGNGTRGPRFPQVIFDASKDGRPIGYSPSPLDFSNHAINATSGRIMIIFWGLDDMSAFVLAPQ
jgi:hypothetical protein